MSDKKCAAEKKAEMDSVITQVSSTKIYNFLGEQMVSDQIINVIKTIFSWTTTPSKS